MQRRRLERLAALTRGPILLVGEVALAGAGMVACAQPQGSNVVTAPTATASDLAAQGAPALPDGATAATDDAAPAGSTATMPNDGTLRPGVNAPFNPMWLDGGVPEGGFRRPINAPRFLPDGGRLNGTRPPVNALPNAPPNAPGSGSGTPPLP